MKRYSDDLMGVLSANNWLVVFLSTIAAWVAANMPVPLEFNEAGF